MVCEHVVSPTGSFARRTGAMVGLDVPVIPVQHLPTCSPSTTRTRSALPARPLRTAPCHDRLKALGGVFGQKFGWERANWFAPKGVEAVDD